MASELEPVTDHVEQGLALLLQQYQDKPRLAAWLSSYLRQVQLLEDAAWEVDAQRDLDTATGIYLDVIGRKVGQPRVGPDDDTYRMFLRVRVRVNMSDGHASDIIAVTRLATNGARNILYPLHHASFVVDVLDPLDSILAPLASLIAGLIAEATGAGIESSLHWSDDEESETFAFSESDVEEEDDDRGLADDDGTEGGVLIGAF